MRSVVNKLKYYGSKFILNGLLRTAEEEISSVKTVLKKKLKDKKEALEAEKA